MADEQPLALGGEVGSDGYADLQTDCFIPAKSRDPERSAAILRRAMEWYGARVEEDGDTSTSGG